MSNYSTLKFYNKNYNIIELYACPLNYFYDPKNEKSDINGCVRPIYNTTTLTPNIKNNYKRPKKHILYNLGCCNMRI